MIAVDNSDYVLNANLQNLIVYDNRIHSKGRDKPNYEAITGYF